MTKVVISTETKTNLEVINITVENQFGSGKHLWNVVGVSIPEFHFNDKILKLFSSPLILICVFFLLVESYFHLSFSSLNVNRSVLISYIIRILLWWPSLISTSNCRVGKILEI